MSFAEVVFPITVLVTSEKEISRIDVLERVIERRLSCAQCDSRHISILPEVYPGFSLSRTALSAVSLQSNAKMASGRWRRPASSPRRV